MTRDSGFVDGNGVRANQALVAALSAAALVSGRRRFPVTVAAVLGPVALSRDPRLSVGGQLWSVTGRRWVVPVPGSGADAVFAAQVGTVCALVAAGTWTLAPRVGRVVTAAMVAAATAAAGADVCVACSLHPYARRVRRVVAGTMPGGGL